MLYYLWKVLFLGLTDAVYIFTKLLLPIVKHLRKVGWRGIIYINDIGTIGKNFQECLYWKFFARDVLGCAGWVINTSKDQIPAQDNVLLGAVVDTKAMQFKIPNKKMEEIKDLIQQALAKSKSHIKEIAKIVGKLISFYRCTGPVARVMKRDTY